MAQTLTFGSRSFAFSGIDDDLFVVGLDGVSAALVTALRYRTRGDRFVVFPIHEDSRVANAPDPAALDTLAIVCRLACAVVVRSRAEAARIRAFCSGSCPLIVRLPAHSVPDFTPHDAARSIVVWAPHLERARLAVILAALEEIAIPRLVVCADPIDGAAIAYAGLERAAEILPSARLIVDAQAAGPEDAIAFAARGVALAVASTSGAAEFVDHAASYDPWDRRSIVGAVLAGIVQPAATLSGQEWRPQALVRAVRILEREPPVSIVVRTKDRPTLLRRALASALAQCWSNLDVVVVNDGGCDVASVVAQYEGARLIQHETTRGMEAAANAGLRMARGTYVGLLDDDDALFPNHVATLATALERSRAAIAHSDVLTLYVRSNGDGSYAARGAKLFIDRATLPSDLFHTCMLLPLSTLFRRSALERLGGFPEDMPIMGDWETFLRFSAGGDIVHVPNVTALYSVRDDGDNATTRQSDAFASSFALIQRRHPIHGRPALHARQTAMVANRLAAGAPRWPQPALAFPDPFALDVR